MTSGLSLQSKRLSPDSSWGCACGDTHPAPHPRGTVVLEPAYSPPSPPLCCPPRQKAGVPEKGSNFV